MEEEISSNQRAVGDHGGEPPAPVGFVNVREAVVEVHAVRLVPPARGRPVAAVTVVRHGETAMTSHVVGRPEVALVRAITAEIRRAGRLGCHGLRIRLKAPWLPKALLQRARRFGSPILFAAVLAMHRAAVDHHVDVTLVGGTRESP